MYPDSPPQSISPLASDAPPAAAVSIVSGEGDERGVIRFVQLTPPDLCLLEGTVTGLAPGPHCLCIHEYGDLTDGCNGSVVGGLRGGLAYNIMIYSA